LGYEPCDYTGQCIARTCCAKSRISGRVNEDLARQSYQSTSTLQNENDIMFRGEIAGYRNPLVQHRLVICSQQPEHLSRMGSKYQGQFIGPLQVIGPGGQGIQGIGVDNNRRLPLFYD
jgi:hypothetical protein